MEVPRLGVELKLFPPAYAAATATPDPSCVYNLHHSSQQCQNPLSKARDQTSWILVRFVSEPRQECRHFFFVVGLIKIQYIG